MRQKSRSVGSHGEKVVKDIRRATRKQYSAEEILTLPILQTTHNGDTVFNPVYGCRHSWKSSKRIRQEVHRI